jgi:hypothetical protein
VNEALRNIITALSLLVLLTDTLLLTVAYSTPLTCLTPKYPVHILSGANYHVEFLCITSHHEGDESRWWKQQAPLKRRWTYNRLDGVTSQKTVIFILSYTPHFTTHIYIHILILRAIFSNFWLTSSPPIHPPSALDSLLVHGHASKRKSKLFLIDIRTRRMTSMHIQVLQTQLPCLSISL